MFFDKLFWLMLIIFLMWKGDLEHDRYAQGWTLLSALILWLIHIADYIVDAIKEKKDK